MKSGSNKLTILAVDISGNPALGLLNASWITEGSVAGSAIETATVTEASGGDGFYSAEVIVPQGQGYLFIKNTNTNIYVTPDFFAIEADAHSLDEIYSKLNVTLNANVPVISPNRYGIATLNVKQDSDIVETIQVPSRFIPLTGVTNLTVQCFPASRLINGNVPPISGTYSAVVSNASAGLIDIHIDDNVVQSVIPSGASSATIYGDIKFLDAAGHERRAVELQINVRRDFNNNA